MPNYVTNNCDFNLSLTELLWVWVLIDVTDYKDKNYKNWYYNLRFNLHLLFPDYFVDEYFEYSYLSDSQTKDKSQKDFIINNTFDNKWNYDWYVNHIWCKWDVNIEVFCGNPDEPNFSCWFESPRSTPEWIFKSLHWLWIWFYNEYEEPWCCIQWVCEWTLWMWFIHTQEEYVPMCSHCEKKIEWTEYCDELGEDVCPDCLSNAWSTCCWASINNWVCSDCKEHNEWYKYEE